MTDRMPAMPEQVPEVMHRKLETDRKGQKMSKPSQLSPGQKGLSCLFFCFGTWGHPYNPTKTPRVSVPGVPKKKPRKIGSSTSRSNFMATTLPQSETSTRVALVLRRPSQKWYGGAAWMHVAFSFALFVGWLMFCTVISLVCSQHLDVQLKLDIITACYSLLFLARDRQIQNLRKATLQHLTVAMFISQSASRDLEVDHRNFELAPRLIGRSADNMCLREFGVFVWLVLYVLSGFRALRFLASWVLWCFVPCVSFWGFCGVWVSMGFCVFLCLLRLLLWILGFYGFRGIFVCYFCAFLAFGFCGSSFKHQRQQSQQQSQQINTNQGKTIGRWRNASTNRKHTLNILECCKSRTS